VVHFPSCCPKLALVMGLFTRVLVQVVTGKKRNSVLQFYLIVTCIRYSHLFQVFTEFLVNQMGFYEALCETRDIIINEYELM
jgi:hypothetical protein